MKPVVVRLRFVLDEVMLKALAAHNGSRTRSDMRTTLTMLLEADLETIRVEYDETQAADESR